jgi:hypothetical protein
MFPTRGLSKLTGTVRSSQNLALHILLYVDVSDMHLGMIFIYLNGANTYLFFLRCNIDNNPL